MSWWWWWCQFLEKALLPLHKPKCVAIYHQQLSYCIIQYVEKDPETAITILQGLVKYWPWSCSSKQVGRRRAGLAVGGILRVRVCVCVMMNEVLFLNELEEILELLGQDQLMQVQPATARQAGRRDDQSRLGRAGRREGGAMTEWADDDGGLE